MRIFHTADWHLGKLLHGESLNEDQAYILSSITNLAVESEPDVIIIAGDLYDRAVPPASAVRLLSDTLVALNEKLPEVPILAIAGNHDSADRLEFAADLLARNRVHIVGSYRRDARPVRLEDEHGPVDFFLLPYLYPVDVRVELKDDLIQSHELATKAALGAWSSHMDDSARKVLIAHAFVEGGKESDSERPVAMGGSGFVHSSVFDEFDYVALGHLHEPQYCGRPEVSYAGSPLKYSMSETDHKKSITIADLDGDGRVAIDVVPLHPMRDLRRIDGTLEDLLNQPPLPGTADDYVVVELTDRGALLDPMGRLREIYPKILSIDRPHLDRVSRDPDTELSREDLKQSEVDLFTSFYQQVTGEELETDQIESFEKVVEQVLSEDN